MTKEIAVAEKNPEIVLLVATPSKGPPLPIFAEVWQLGPEAWSVRMQGRVDARTEKLGSREAAICAAMGFRS